MNNRILVAVTLAAALLAVDGLGPTHSSASAQEVQITGPLAGAPAVRNMRAYRAGRIQLQPGFAITLQDEFDKALLFTVQAQYHFTDWLGVGVWGGFAGVHLDTGLTDEVRAQGVTTDRNILSLPSREGFSNQIGNMTWIFALQGTFIPLRGKLALFQKLFVDTDFYIFAGAALLGIEERADVSVDDVAACEVMVGAARQACYAQTQRARSSRATAAPTFGAGLTMYFNDFVGLSLEWRGLPFAWNTSGTDECCNEGRFPDGEIDSQDRISHFNHMFQLGVVIYLPTEVEVTE